MYRISYILGGDKAYRDKAMRMLLAALTLVDKEFIAATPDALPLKSLRFREEAPGEDDWLDASALQVTRGGDCEEICAYVAGWLQARHGILAWPQLVEDGHGHTHIVVELPDGRQFDPTLMIGRKEKHDHACTALDKNAPEQKITFVTNLFKSRIKIGFHGQRQAPQSLAHKSLTLMLHALFLIDVLWLKDHPETPGIYEAGVIYKEEPNGREDWQDIPSSIRRGDADCLPLSTLVLREDYTFAALGDLKAGDRIMGDGCITTVLDHLVTGEKPILAFTLDNGSILRCSPEHRLFLENGEEIRAKDVHVGQRLKAPSSPFPASKEDWTWGASSISSKDFAWLVGVYAADGWTHTGGSSFSISGFDEKPKRGKVEQKERVQAIAERAGLHARWAKKSITVNDRPLAELIKQCGLRAPEKRVADLHRFSLEQVKALLEGLQTDCSTASSGTLTHGTVSRELALQLRVLYRMLGQSVHIKRWDEHGGLGAHPIYRVGVRRLPDESMPKNWQTRAEQSVSSVKVWAIHEEPEEICADITTDTGRFYLPESDTIVHNCEDLANWRAAELTVRSRVQARPNFIWRVRPSGAYLYHIQTLYPDGRVEDPSRKLGMGGH